MGWFHLLDVEFVFFSCDGIPEIKVMHVRWTSLAEPGRGRAATFCRRVALHLEIHVLFSQFEKRTESGDRQANRKEREKLADWRGILVLLCR